MKGKSRIEGRMKLKRIEVREGEGGLVSEEM